MGTFLIVIFVILALAVGGVFLWWHLRKRNLIRDLRDADSPYVCQRVMLSAPTFSDLEERAARKLAQMTVLEIESATTAEQCIERAMPLLLVQHYLLKDELVTKLLYRVCAAVLAKQPTYKQALLLLQLLPKWGDCGYEKAEHDTVLYYALAVSGDSMMPLCELKKYAPIGSEMCHKIGLEGARRARSLGQLVLHWRDFLMDPEVSNACRARAAELPQAA